MPKVLKATPEQYEKLNGYTNGVSMIEFIEDANGGYVISVDVVQDEAFSEIHSDLLKLELVEYTPRNEQ